MLWSDWGLTLKISGGQQLLAEPPIQCHRPLNLDVSSK
ncbi:hypothetical protein SynA1544_01762 [Synechococcus sp. A15-44]|nr:hypothetical protein SynA1544_01762 [Synechococcus sp. A15-44]